MNTGPTKRNPACMNMKAMIASSPNSTARFFSMVMLSSASLPARSMCRSQSAKSSSTTTPATTNGMTGETPPSGISVLPQPTMGTRAAVQPYLLACSTPSTTSARPSAERKAPR